MWERFREGREAQLWYYGALAAVYERVIPGRMANELEATVQELQRTTRATDDGSPAPMAPETKTPGSSGNARGRLDWVDVAIADTTAWIEREVKEAKTELSFATPGEWDYDYNTDLLRQTKQAANTVAALHAERELILACDAHLRHDTESGKYHDET